MRHHLIALLTVVAAVLPFAGCASGAASDLSESPTAGDLLAAGRAEEEAGNLSRADELYDRLLSDYPADPLVEDAEWRAAEISFRREHWKSARAAYQEFHETHPMSRLGELEDRMYSIGLGLYDDGRAGLLGLRIFQSDGEAMKTMQWLVDNLPEGFRADNAIFFMAEKSMEGEKWQDAVFHLDRLLEDYPESEWALEGRFRKAWCHRQLNRGPAYDRSSLITARKHVEIYIRDVSRSEARKAEYSDRLAEARELVREIDGLLASNALRIARFYLSQERYDAAAIYLDHVVREYPDTEPAGEARELFGEARGAE